MLSIVNHYGDDDGIGVDDDDNDALSTS